MESFPFFSHMIFYGYLVGLYLSQDKMNAISSIFKDISIISYILI